MAFTQKVADLNESRNLNTSPWTVSGLKGDKFDYSFIVVCKGTGSIDNNSSLQITFNSDSGANYNNNEMGSGSGGILRQGDTTGDTFIKLERFAKNEAAKGALCTGAIRGHSSQNRTVSTIFSMDGTRIYNTFHEWTDNINELNSVTFKSAKNLTMDWHIVIFEIPKVGNNDNWELVDTLSWSASATEQSFTGLEGDTDLFYKLEWDSQVEPINIEINNATTGYTREYVINSGTAFVASGDTPSAMRLTTSGVFLLKAETGNDRTAVTFSGPDAGSNKHYIEAYWYSDTATEVTSLDCTPQGSVTATAKLYRAKYPSSCTPDIFDLPFEKIDSFSVNTADFTAGQSFTGLEGDKVLLYRIEWKGNNNDILWLRTNGDSGASDYARQYVQGSGTAESAGSDTSASNLTFVGDSNGDESHVVFYIYPQSGEHRPGLSYYMEDEDTVTLFAHWRSDTVTEITSILLYADGATTVNGTFTLSAIYL